MRPATSGFGTKRTCRLCCAMSALGGKAENICSHGVFPVLTLSGLLFCLSRQLGVRCTSSREGGHVMKSALLPTLILALSTSAGFVASPSIANARASGVATDHSFQARGSVAEHPGASGYAPRRLIRAHGNIPGHPGASGYAPGHRFVHH